METQNPTLPETLQQTGESHPSALYPPVPPAPAASPRSPFEKTPLLAALFSLIPGVGNIYNGLYLRGLSFAVLCFGLLLVGATKEEPTFIPAIIFCWLFNIIDAYRQATFINYGYPRGRRKAPAFPEENGAAGGMVLGIAIFLVGTYGLLTHVFPTFDIQEIFQYWYLGFLGFGAWLVFKTVKERNTQDEEEFPYSAASESRGSETREEAA